MADFKYQVRFQGGIEDFEHLADALNSHDRQWDKVSWTINNAGDRVILRGDSTWEIWDKAYLKKLAGVEL